jgi:hypothetical protein
MTHLIEKEKNYEILLSLSGDGDDRRPVLRDRVNFYSVGRAREACRTCLLADLGDAPLCEHLYVYTYRERSGGNWVIRAQVECSLDEGAPPDSRCATCPISERLVLTTPAEAAMLVLPAGAGATPGIVSEGR